MPNTPHASCMVSPSSTFTNALQSSGPPSVRFFEGNGDAVSDTNMTAASKPEPSQRDARALAGQLNFTVPPLGRGNNYPGSRVPEQPVDADPLQPRFFGGKANIAGGRQLGQRNRDATLCNVGRRGHNSRLDEADHAILQAPLDIQVKHVGRLTCCQI